jgi:exoribonuclease II
MEQLHQNNQERTKAVEDLRTQIQEDRRQTRKIAEEMGDWTVSIGVDEDEIDLDLDRLTIEALDGTQY